MIIAMQEIPALKLYESTLVKRMNLLMDDRAAGPVPSSISYQS